ncbi:hypothetical protein J7643_15060, partial [bacterium]|nr:hypothetical protein [bacterium]
NPDFNIDFFVMDEIYKISEPDDRSLVFMNCLYRLARMARDFYLIGPYFSDFSKAFMKSTNARMIHFESEIVQKDEFYFGPSSRSTTIDIGNKKWQKYKNNDKNLARIINNIDGQSLVYAGSKRSVETRTKRISDASTVVTDNKYLDALIEYIESNVSHEWSLIKYLRTGVAFHHAGLPKFVASEIVDAFNAKAIRVIVCSPTLIEGVNTTARNVIFAENTKGTEPLSGFDVKNIKGRAGRLGSHFIGRSISLVDLPTDEELDNVDFALFDYDDLTPEENILLDEEDLSKYNLSERKRIVRELDSYHIPIELIRKNKYIPIFKQVALITTLRNNPDLVECLRFSGAMPKKAQIDGIIEICFNNLFTEADKGVVNARLQSLSSLKFFTKMYLYGQPTIKDMIAKHSAAHIDTRVRAVFSLIYKYFEYALPRYLAAFENLYNFVCPEKPINLAYVITKLEYGFVEDHEISLRETGLPTNLVNKVAKRFLDCSNVDEVRAKAKIDPRTLDGLSDFEMAIARKYL